MIPVHSGPFLLRKLLPSLLLPHGLALTLLLLALLTGSSIPLLAALVLLITFSLPLLADGLWTSLETGQQRLSPQQVPSAVAIVLLGGEPLHPPDPEEGCEGGERFRMALALLQAGRAPQLLFAGSHSPLGSHLPLEGERHRRAGEPPWPGSAQSRRGATAQRLQQLMGYRIPKVAGDPGY